MSSNIFSEVLWNGILGDEEEMGPEISNNMNGKSIFGKCRLLFNLRQRNDIA